ncbi:MAG: TonB-dependent receptor [Pseudomonadota bacterium]
MMQRYLRTPIVIISTLSLSLTAQVAMSQDSNSGDSDTNVEDRPEVILVTASKRETGLQETPIAITVTSAETIEQTKILDIQDLQAVVPTLRVTPLETSANTNFAIRGFGNGTNNIGIEPSVGVFIDGVYRSRAAAQIGDLPRLEQIEILSGPQSTLFGKNASAGVINVRTAAPSFAPEGRIELGVGNHNLRLVRGYYTNGITENAAFSISGGINQRDGYTASIVGLGELNENDRFNLRGQLLFTPTDQTTVRIIGDYFEIDELCCTVADVINGPTTAAIRALGGIVLDDADPFSYQSALNNDPRNTVEDGGISVEVDVEYDDFDLTSITAYRDNMSGFTGDVDFTSLDILFEERETDVSTFTQELRLTSTGTADFQWMVGAFIFIEELESGIELTYGESVRDYFNALGLADLLGGYEQIFGQTPGTFFQTGQFIDTQFTQDNDAYSLFTSLDYAFNDRLTATFGISYIKDTKDVTVTSENTEAFSAIDLENDPTIVPGPAGNLTLPQIFEFAAVNPALAQFVPLAAPQAIAAGQAAQFLPPAVVFPNAVEDGKTDDSKTTWSVRLAYEVNNNVNIFATAATGFKASSWNLSRDSRPFPEDEAALTDAGLVLANQSFGTRFAGPEETEVFEVGLKSRFASGAFNITFFDQTIEGFQSSTFVGTGFVLANAGQQSTKGAEFDVKWRPTSNLDITFAGLILDPVFDSFEGASGIDGPVDLTGEQPFGVHDRSFTLGATYNFDFNNGWFGYVRTDYQYENDVPTVSNVPESIRREVKTWNASAGLDFDNGFAAQLWARNLFNDEYFLSSFPPPIQAGSFNAYPNPPRTFGASVTYSF